MNLSSISSPLILTATALFILSCQPQNLRDPHKNTFFHEEDTTIKTGGVKMVPVKTAHGTFNVWTKRIGNNPKIKILMLAGGPGLPHDYLEVFESFFPEQGFEMIFYDELGSGNSDNPKDSTLYDINRSVEEVEQLRQALNLNRDNFYLYGHSWGGALAIQYALKYQLDMKALIISNMNSSGKEFNRYVRYTLTKYFPKTVLDTLNGFAARKDFENPKYTALVRAHFYSRFICRLPPEEWPEPVLRSLNKMNKPYYLTMQGPDEFTLRGKILYWDVSTQLPQLSIPTLTIGAKYDEMNPANMKWMARQVQNGSYLYCAKGSHLSMYDEQKTYMDGIIKFIKAVNKGALRVSLTTEN